MLISYVVFNVLNVIIQTIKSIVTIKCNKYIAAVVNAVAYGLYTYVIILTNIEIDLWFKIITVALANLIGVFVVKYFEEKNEKEKLWLVKMTVPHDNKTVVTSLLEQNNIPFTCYELPKYIVFDTYCNTKKDTKTVIDICKINKGKSFGMENKLNL